MKRYSFEFPVSLVKQYLYCLRIPYFILVMGYEERKTELMRYGMEKHKKMLKKLRKQGWKTDVFLRSEKYGIYGSVDGLRRIRNGFQVYEYKNLEFRKKILKIHLYQTACYALLVEENFGRVVLLTVGYLNKEVDVPFTLGIRNYAVSVINKIHRIYELGFVPVQKDRRRCLNCGFRKICKEI